MLIKNLLQEDSARQLQTYATSSDLTTAATRLFRFRGGMCHPSNLEFFLGTLGVAVWRLRLCASPLVSAFIRGGQQVV